MKWLDIGKIVLVPMLYPFVLLSSFIFRIIQSLIYAAIGLIFAGWCKTKLSYYALLRLTVTAVTPCIIVRTVLEYASIRIPLANLWFFIAAMGFLFCGIKVCSQTAEQTTIEDELSQGNQDQPPGF